MTNTEFSNEFDVLYNNIMSNAAPGLNEYEKSVFLTKALDEIIKNYFNPKGNKYQEGFDDSAKRQIDFSMLIKTEIPLEANSENPIHLGNNIKYYLMPKDIFLYINEFLDVNRKGNINRLTVVPLSYDEYARLMSKPFKRPLKNQAWRLITSGEGLGYTYTDYGYIAKIISDVDSTAEFKELYSTIYGKKMSVINHSGHYYLKVEDKYLGSKGTLVKDLENAFYIDAVVPNISGAINANVAATSTIVQLVPGNNDLITQYFIRYIRKPRPIILEDLEGDVSIGGEKKESYCELDTSLHQEILQRAVELAKAAYTGDLNSQVALGVNSQTNLGMLASR